ncbi:MAG: hypothetical protein EOO88_52570, partial [Pedobacter sp.]
MIASRDKRKLIQLSLGMLFYLLMPVIANAQLDPLHVRTDTAVLLRSKVLSEDRTLWIHLPADYNSGKNTYPVLYLLDGEGHFDYATQLVTFLSSYDRNRIPDMIVVGIVNVDRGRDFTPVYSKSAGNRGLSNATDTAGAGRFLHYIKKEVIPYIDTHYR